MLHRADGVGGASGTVHIQCKAKGVRTQGRRGLLSLPLSALCATWPCIQPLRVSKTWDLLTIEDNNHFFLAHKWSHSLQLSCAHLTTDGKILKDFDP